MDTRICLVTARAEVGHLVRQSLTSADVAVDEVDAARARSADAGIVLADTQAVAGWLEATGSPRDGAAAGAVLVVVHLAGEGAAAERAATAARAHAVVEVPLGAQGLRRLLAGAPTTRLLAVLSAVGGVGATTLAIGCAAAAHDPLLVDSDPWSTGLDLPLGIGPEQGARWGSVPDTTLPLVAETLRSGLPRVQGITVLTGPLPSPTGDRVAAAVGVGRAGFGSVVVDCGRSSAGVPLADGDHVVVVTPATLAGAVASRRALDLLGEHASPVLAVRLGGYLPTADLAEHLGVATVIEVPRLARLPESAERGEVLAGRVGRGLVGVGRRVWQAVG